MTETLSEELRAVIRTYPVKITAHYKSLIREKDDPIWRQCMPSEAELGPLQDALPDDGLGEIPQSPCPHLIHRYADRVVLLSTNRCFALCRFCFRKRLWKEPPFIVTEGELDEVTGYLRNHPEVRDILISGGDPLTIPDEQFFPIVDRLAAVPSLEIIRVCSRAPVFEPSRITEAFAERLGRCEKTWFMTHFNHPRELTADLLTAKSIPRNSETFYTNGVYYTEPESISVLFLVSGCLFFAAGLVALGATLFLHPKKKGNGAATAALLVFALGGAVFAGAFPSLPSAEAASVSSDFDITCDYAYDAAAILDTEVKMEGYGSYRMDIYPADWCVGGNFGNIVITANPPKDTTLTNENAAVTGYLWIDSKADIVDSWSDSLNIKMSRYYNGQPVIGGSAQSKIMTRKLDFASLQENSWNFFAIPLSEFTQVNPAEPFELDELKFFSIGVGANTSDTNIRIDAIKFVDKNVPGNMEEPTGDNAYSTSDTLVGYGGTVVYHGEPFLPENVDPAVTSDAVADYPYGTKQALSIAATAVSGVLFAASAVYAAALFLKKRRSDKNSAEGRAAR